MDGLISLLLDWDVAGLCTPPENDYRSILASTFGKPIASYRTELNEFKARARIVLYCISNVHLKEGYVVCYSTQEELWSVVIRFDQSHCFTTVLTNGAAG